MPLTLIESDLLLNCLVVNLFKNFVAALRLIIFHVDTNGSIGIVFSKNESIFSVVSVVNIDEHLLDGLNNFLLNGPLEFFEIDLEVATFLLDQLNDEACSHIVNQVREF